MPRIAVLPAAVADQIAAGEVVERPASVLKELIENALDAGATGIEISVEEGGRRTIRVGDDGCGMEREDALLALERHATSKIRAAEDIVAVDTFGFRGEALPAICSVSRLVLETAPIDGTGTLIRAAGGAVEEVREVARRRGTTVTVSQLFYNTPARRKFLRGARSEWRAVMDAITTLAIVRRDVRLTLTHDGRPVMSLPAAGSLRARVGALWGGSWAEGLVEVEDVSGAIHVCGLAERPAEVGTQGRRTAVAVNGRAVRDAGILRAAETAYRSTIPAGVRPSLLLELTVPADAVDVNVHPAKAEVRFRDRWTLERAVEAAVRRALGTFDSAPVLGARRWWSVAPAGLGAVATQAVDREVLHPHTAPRSGLFAVEAPGAPQEEPSVVADADSAAVVPPLVQLRRTYIMFERDEGVVLIDQHSAHERVLYEQFMRTLDGGGSPSQRLLLPLTLHLGPAEGEALEANRDAFERLGFEMEGFGGHTVMVRAVPMPHPRFDAERCLRQTLDALTGDRFAAAAARHERLAATVACKAAVKAGDPLSGGEMRELFLSLGRTTLPAHDVHGRATIVQLPWEELERRFGRR